MRLSVCLSVCLSVDVHVEYPSSLIDKYIVGEFLAESALSVLNGCTDRYTQYIPLLIGTLSLLSAPVLCTTRFSS